MKYKIVPAALAILFLAGCSAEKVIVLDDAGSPVHDAQVYAASLSMNTGPVKTDANGEAAVPSNVQGAEWVWVKKDGYRDLQVPIPTEWPLTITLKKK